MAQSGGHQQGSDLVAIQTDGPGLVVQLRATHMDRWGLGDPVLLLGVAVKAHDGRQTAGDGGSGPALVFQPTGVELDVGTGYREQFHLPLRAPETEHADIQRVSLPGPPGVPGQETGHGNARGTEQRPDRHQLDSRQDSSPFTRKIHHPPSRSTAHDVPIADAGRAAVGRVLERTFGDTRVVEERARN
jgi:hypothetical protein